MNVNPYLDHFATCNYIVYSQLLIINSLNYASGKGILSVV